MQLIFNLRGHMEQLHKEIFDLRKSLHTCMEMQVNLQQFMIREAESVKSHSSEYIFYAHNIRNNIGSYLILSILLQLKLKELVLSIEYQEKELVVFALTQKLILFCTGNWL